MTLTPTIDEAGTATLAGSFTDPGVNDSFVLLVTWGDGTTSTRSFAPGRPKSFSFSHAFADDNPTTTPVDRVPVRVQLSDKDGGKALAAPTVTVRNLAPTNVTLSSATTGGVAAQRDAQGFLTVAEAATVTWTGTFRDVGLADASGLSVSWGDGTQVTVATAVRDTADPALVRFSATHVYADDNPTASASDLDGVKTLLGTQGVAIPFRGSLTDPGSDDETITWAFGDGLTNVTTNLVNPPAPDPAVSPAIQPRSFGVGNDHPYARPCLYRATLSATDDDNGSAVPDGIDVVVLAIQHRWESLGFWKNAYDARNSTISAADLACYLRIAGYTSQVFGAGDRVAIDTSAQASDVLFKNPGSPPSSSTGSC